MKGLIAAILAQFGRPPMPMMVYDRHNLIRMPDIVVVNIVAANEPEYIE